MKRWEIELGGEHYDIDTGILTEDESHIVRRFKVADIATIKEIDGEMRLTTASPPFPGILGSPALAFTTVRFFAPRVAIGVVSGKVVREVTEVSGNVRREPVEGAIARLFGSEVVPVYFAETNKEGLFVIPAMTTMGLFEQRELSLLVFDPLSAISHHRAKVPINLVTDPFAQTYPESNIVVAAILDEDFVLESEERIREDKTPPSIDIRFSAATLVDNIMDEGDALTIDINVSDIRDSHPVVENIVMNGELTFIGEPDTHQHVIANIQGGLYYIEVTAYDNAMPSNSRSLQKIILVRTLGESPGSVEGPPSFITYSVDYIGEEETVDINTDISITFNEPIDRATVDDTTFVVRNVTTGEIITGRFVFTDYDSTITFIPDQRLKYGHEYKVEIVGGITGIRDTEGNPVIFVDPITFKTNSPQVINSYPILGAKDLAVKGTTAYVTDYYREDATGLTIVDFKAPDVINFIKQLQLRSDLYSSYAIAVSGRYAYVITVGGVIPGTFTLLSTLQQWNIADPSVPVKVTWVPLTTEMSLSGTIPVRLVVSEGLVFVAMINSGFKIFDASDLTPLQNAEFVNTSAGNSQAADIAVLGEYAYIANGPTGELVVVKFTNPDGNISQFYTDELGDIKPGYSVAGRVTIPGSVNAYRVKVIGNFRVKDGNGYVYRNLAFVSCLEKGMAIVDITDPANPEHLYTLSIPGRVIGLDIDKEAGIAVLSASSGGLRIVNFQDFDLQDRASTIYELGYVDLGSPTKGGGIIVSNGIAYVTMENDVQLVRIKNPSLVDIDVDSDNNNEFNLPDRSDEEEQIENIWGDSSNPGKIFLINNGDADNDMISDFADFDIAALPGDEVYFTPVVLGLSETVDLNKVLIKFIYSESDPNQMAPPTGSGTPDDPYVYEPASGHLRIWTKNGVVMRNKNEVGSGGGGDFVKSGIIYSAAQLGFISGPASTHLVVFFMEGIRTPVNIDDSRVKVEIDPNGVEGGIDFISQDIVMLAMSDLNITVDSNNDGNVDKQDEDVEDYKRFIFWVNDDDNSSDKANDHEASIVSTIDQWAWNSSDERINGIFDLIDLAPIKIHVDEKIRKSLKLLNYRLFVRSEGVRYFASSRSNTHNGKLIPDKVHDYETQDSYLTLKNLAEDQVWQPSLGGITGDVEIVWDHFDADGNLWLLFEGVGAYSETTVSLILEGPNSNHQFVTDAVKVRLKRSEDFFKTYSVRDSQNNDVEYITERLKNKSEEPDPRKTTIDRYGPEVQVSGSINDTNNLLIFVHGYNVTADFANVSYQSAFKRLYRMGYRSDMIAYKWEGNQTRKFDPNVENAFESSQTLMDLILQQKSHGKTINIAAHSLGNLVVLDALRLLTYHDPAPNVGSIKNLIHIEAAVWDAVYDERPSDYIDRAIEQKLMWNHWCSDVPSIVTGNIVNSYNREDSALKWMIRNDYLMTLLGRRYDIPETPETINLDLFPWRTPNNLAYNISGAYNSLDLQTHPIGDDNINVALNFNANRYGWKIRQHSGFRENYYYEVYEWWKDIVFRFVD